MPVTRVSERLAPMVEEALSLLAPKEDLMWEIGPIVTPQGAFNLLAISAKGAVLGTVLTGTAIIGDPWGDQEKVNKMVGDLLKPIFEARSGQLQAPGQKPEGLPGTRGPQVAHTTNGHGH